MQKLEILSHIFVHFRTYVLILLNDMSMFLFHDFHFHSVANFFLGVLEQIPGIRTVLH